MDQLSLPSVPAAARTVTSALLEAGQAENRLQHPTQGPKPKGTSLSGGDQVGGQPRLAKELGVVGEKQLIMEVGLVGKRPLPGAGLRVTPRCPDPEHTSLHGTARPIWSLL